MNANQLFWCKPQLKWKFRHPRVKIETFVTRILVATMILACWNSFKYILWVSKDLWQKRCLTNINAWLKCNLEMMRMKHTLWNKRYRLCYFSRCNIVDSLSLFSSRMWRYFDLSASSYKARRAPQISRNIVFLTKTTTEIPYPGGSECFKEFVEENHFLL